MSDTINNVFDLFNTIIKLYLERKTQKEIADTLNISEEDVASATRLANFCHTKKLTPENCKEGQKLNMVVSDEQLCFLKKYFKN